MDEDCDWMTLHTAGRQGNVRRTSHCIFWVNYNDLTGNHGSYERNHLFLAARFRGVKYYDLLNICGCCLDVLTGFNHLSIWEREKRHPLNMYLWCLKQIVRGCLIRLLIRYTDIISRFVRTISILFRYVFHETLGC